MGQRIKIRRDTSAGWAAANPVLDDGEVAYDKTLKLLKVGDGVTAWSDLFFGGGSKLSDAIATTSGTTIKVSGIPANATEINITLSGVSVNAATPLILRLGSALSSNNSGYVSTASAGAAILTNTTGFVLLPSNTNATFIGGVITLRKVRTGNVQAWSISGSLTGTSMPVAVCAGVVFAVNQPYTDLYLSTVTGTALFDAGEIYVEFK